jgi:four helix bundle protein
VGAIKKFEEIRSWQKARELVNSVYRVTSSGQFAKDVGLRDQIRRAAGSVMHNIAEGFDSGSDAEFKRFLRISMRSVSEVQSQLYMALDQRYLEQAQFDALYKEAELVKGFIRKFVFYLSQNGKHNSVSEQKALYEIEGISGSPETLDIWTLDEDGT